MTLAETMNVIEQEDFAAEMNLAAGTKAFRRAIRGHELFKQLSGFAKDNPAAVAGRIETISRLEVDERYENRFDTGLSAYMLALSDVAQPEVTHEAAQAVLRTPKTWWAASIAREQLLQAVAVGVVGMGSVGSSVSSLLTHIAWHEAFHVDVANWFNRTWAPPGDDLMRKLRRALVAGQPSGQEQKVIEMPSAERRVSQPDLAKGLKRRKTSARLHSIVQRKRA